MYISIPEFNIYKSTQEPFSYLLVLNNKQFLYMFLNDLYSGCTNKEYIKILDNDNKQLKFSDYVDFIPSLINLSINNKKNINSLIRLLKKQNNTILQETSKKILDILNDSFNEIKLDSPIDIYSDIELSDDDIMKYLNIMIKEEDNDSLLERINLYIKTSFELRNIKIFIFHNLYSLLQEDEIKLLIDSIKYNGISIINIENNIVNNTAFNKIKILDYDNCLLENN